MLEETLSDRMKKREEEIKRTVERQKKYSKIVFIIIIISVSLVFITFKVEKPAGMKKYIETKYGTKNIKNIKKNKKVIREETE